MKLVPLKNVTGKRLVFPNLRDMNFEVGETRWVSPAVLAHPSIACRLGKGFDTRPEKTEEAAPPKKVEEPTAPESPTSVPAESVTQDEPIAVEETETVVSEDSEDEVPVEELEEEPKEDKTTGDSLREAFLAGPGITDANVDAILAEYTALEDLAGATQSDLHDLGVAKSFSKKLLAWAAE